MESVARFVVWAQAVLCVAVAPAVAEAEPLGWVVLRHQLAHRLDDRWQCVSSWLNRCGHVAILTLTQSCLRLCWSNTC